MKHKKKLSIAGRTTDGKTVVQNAFTMVGTHGIPMDIIIDKLYQHDIIIDWEDFYDGAKRDGWKDKTIINRLSCAIIDVFGLEHKKNVIEKLKSKGE